MRRLVCCLILIVLLFSGCTHIPDYDRLDMRGPYAFIVDQGERLISKARDKEYELLLKSNHSMQTLNLYNERYNERCSNFYRLRADTTIGSDIKIIDTNELTVTNRGKLQLGDVNFLVDRWRDLPVYIPEVAANPKFRQFRDDGYRNRFGAETSIKLPSENFVLTLRPQLNFKFGSPPLYSISTVALNTRIKILSHRKNILIIGIDTRYKLKDSEFICTFKIEFLIW